MNQEQLRLCASAEWAALVRDDLLPWVLGDDELGDDVLEIGAGPGLVTDLLVERAHRVTAVEIDEHLAAALRRRLAGRPAGGSHDGGCECAAAARWQIFL